MLTNDLVQFQFDRHLLQISVQAFALIGAKTIDNELQFVNTADFIHHLRLQIVQIVGQMLRRIGRIERLLTMVVIRSLPLSPRVIRSGALPFVTVARSTVVEFASMLIRSDRALTSIVFRCTRLRPLLSSKKAQRRFVTKRFRAYQDGEIFPRGYCLRLVVLRSFASSWHWKNEWRYDEEDTVWLPGRSLMERGFGAFFVLEKMTEGERTVIASALIKAISSIQMSGES